MKTLLTGAGGFLAKRIATSMLGHAPAELILHYRHNPVAPPAEVLAACPPTTTVRTVGANLVAPNALDSALEGVECVIHSAAGMRGAAADMVLNTVVATRNVLESCVRARVKRLVLVSSFAVYRTVGLPAGGVLDESVPLEAIGIEKGTYGYVKLQQERLVEEYRQRAGFDVVTLRPGVIYGPGGGGISPRVGLSAFGFFFRLGGRGLLPLTYVDNCADAISLAAVKASSGVFNVVDDELPTCAAYLRRYRRDVRRLRVIPVPYWSFLLGARQLTRYSERSGGQLPAVFTPHIVRSMYRPLRYSNVALKTLGWVPRVGTEEGLRRTFDSLRAQVSAGT